MQGLDVLDARPARRWYVAPLFGGVLVLVTVAASVMLYRRSLSDGRSIPGILLGDTRLDALPAGVLEREVQVAAQRFLTGTVTLRVGSETLVVARSEAGARVDVAATTRHLLRVGKSGSFAGDLLDRAHARRGKLRVPFAVELDRDAALDFFTELKEKVDRPAVPAKLDLDQQRAIAGRPGYLLHVYDCLVALELGLLEGASTIELAVSTRHAQGKGPKLDGLDISHVLGQFATVYSLADKDRDRAHNLAVGASKLDGRVLAPGQALSFNQTVGKRTEAEGYRMAPVITEGELVDGMAGGACQLSSTLFAAAFFAGLDLESSRPHTRPSAYIKMGLDAAVAYPGTDLMLKNPYPFPVVLHLKVNQGKVRVRILGRKRPFIRVAFEREVKERIPFNREVRRDPTIPRGRRILAQVGVPGFRLERRRLFYGEGKDPTRVEKRELRYPPTTEIVREGAGPTNPDWKPPPEPPPFGEVPPEFTMVQ